MINTNGFFFFFFINLSARFEPEKENTKKKKKKMLLVTNEWMKSTFAKFRLEVCGPKKSTCKYVIQEKRET